LQFVTAVIPSDFNQRDGGGMEKLTPRHEDYSRSGKRGSHHAKAAGVAMSSPAEEKWRAALPKADFFVKSIEVMASFDRLMVTLFSTLIAGIVALLIQENVTFWISAPLVLAGACFGIGLFHTLLHISSMSKMLLLAEWLANGTEVVPQALNVEDHTFPALLRTQAYAQRAFASQLVHLLLGTFFAAIGAVVHLWEYSWRGGIVSLGRATTVSRCSERRDRTDRNRCWAKCR
jgi:hypothetical protein